MDEPPDFDYIEDEDDFEELCREELMNMADHEMEMEMEPDDFEEKNGTLASSAPQKQQELGPYSSPHKMYRSPEVFKELNNEFSKKNRYLYNPFCQNHTHCFFFVFLCNAANKETSL